MSITLMWRKIWYTLLVQYVWLYDFLFIFHMSRLIFIISRHLSSLTLSFMCEWSSELRTFNSKLLASLCARTHKTMCRSSTDSISLTRSHTISNASNFISFQWHLMWGVERAHTLSQCVMMIHAIEFDKLVFEIEMSVHTIWKKLPNVGWGKLSSQKAESFRNFTANTSGLFVRCHCPTIISMDFFSFFLFCFMITFCWLFQMQLNKLITVNLPFSMLLRIIKSTATFSFSLVFFS